MQTECPICYRDVSSVGEVIPSSCAHNLCMDCYTNIILKTQQHQCPMCRVPYALSKYEEARMKRVRLNFGVVFCGQRLNMCKFTYSLL